MSGIAGWMGEGDAETLSRMLAAAAHRGPDGQGEWVGDGVGLGHLALHVTPESVREHQPLVEGELVVVCDARIDNRAELCRRLGLPERSGEEPTDAELILAAYRRWGLECAAELVGDFAFALWDGAQRRLFAARDPLGMRAFYYRAEGRRLLFATEIKQILAVPGVEAELHEPAVAAYLAGGQGPPEWTLYAGILQLAPGHALVASEGGKRTWRYWDIDPERRIRYRRDADYVEHFRELFKEAVRARLRSIRPVGIFLSGGLDSGCIASTAGWLLAHEAGVSVPEFRVYSWAFEELRECDERAVSRQIADHYGFPVTDIPADDAWPLSTQPRATLDVDAPPMFGHYALLERACAMASAHETGLILSGDRGDLVSGMGIFDLPWLLWHGRWIALLRELHALAEWRGTSLTRMARRELVSPVLARWTPAPIRARRRRRRAASMAAAPATPRWISPQLARLLPGEASMDDHDLRRWPSRAAAERYQSIFTELHLRSVVDSGRLHARFHQTFADPWSDRRIAEFAVAIPQRVLNTGFEDKRLTRRVVVGMIPDAARLAMRKTVPLPLYDRGIRERARETIEELLSDSELARRGWVDDRTLRDHYRAIVAGGRDDGYLWYTLSLELWLRAFWPSYAPTLLATGGGAT